jgi:hypothetical protein
MTSWILQVRVQCCTALGNGEILHGLRWGWLDEIESNDEDNEDGFGEDSDEEEEVDEVQHRAKGAIGNGSVQPPRPAVQNVKAAESKTVHLGSRSWEVNLAPTLLQAEPHLSMSLDPAASIGAPFLLLVLRLPSPLDPSLLHQQQAPSSWHRPSIRPSAASTPAGEMTTIRQQAAWEDIHL